MQIDEKTFNILVQQASTGQYINSFAHDINNLLGAAMAYAELLQMNDIDAETDRMAGEIIAATEKGAALVNALTLIARPVRVDKHADGAVNEVLRDIELLFAYDLKLHGIDATYTIAPDVERFQGAGHIVQRVLMRLIQNAVESARDSDVRKIEVSAKRDPNDAKRIRIEVTDSGPDPSPEIIDTMFDAQVTSKKDHAGMGLTTARETVEFCHGTLEYEGHSTFVVTVNTLF
jgi:signal transduction histidine kinase